MANGALPDTWAHGDAYEAYVGRWSRLVAREFLPWLTTGQHLRWLDVGSGTGVLTGVILQEAEPREIVGIDASSAYVADATRRIDDPRVRFEQRDANDLPFVADFDAAVSGLVLNFVPDTRAAVAGMARSVIPGGLVAAYVWDYADRMELMRHFWDAVVGMDPSARNLDEATRFPICDPDELGSAWHAEGLVEVEVAALDVPTRFRDFEDFWSPFLGGQGPAPTYLMSLTGRRRVALRDAVQASLPIAADGSISLTARAWAVKGRTAS